MGKILSSVQLERRAAQRKARETFLAAKAIATLPNTKPYVSKGETSIVHVKSMSDESLIVKMPVYDSTIAKVISIKESLGWLTGTEAAALLNTSIVGFKGNHKSVLRIRVNEAKATPTAKPTGWGTRVVDSIENSYSFPYCLGADTSPTLKEAKAAFTVLFTTGPGAALIAKKGSYAQLIYGQNVESVIR